MDNVGPRTIVSRSARNQVNDMLQKMHAECLGLPIEGLKGDLFKAFLEEVLSRDTMERRTLLQNMFKEFPELDRWAHVLAEQTHNPSERRIYFHLMGLITNPRAGHISSNELAEMGGYYFRLIIEHYKEPDVRSRISKLFPDSCEVCKIMESLAKI